MSCRRFGHIEMRRTIDMQGAKWNNHGPNEASYFFLKKKGESGQVEEASCSNAMALELGALARIPTLSLPRCMTARYYLHVEPPFLLLVRRC